MNYLFELEVCDVNDRITCVLHAKSGRVYLDFSSTLNPKKLYPPTRLRTPKLRLDKMTTTH